MVRSDRGHSKRQRALSKRPRTRYVSENVDRNGKYPKNLCDIGVTGTKRCFRQRYGPLEKFTSSHAVALEFELGPEAHQGERKVRVMRARGLLLCECSLQIDARQRVLTPLEAHPAADAQRSWGGCPTVAAALGDCHGPVACRKRLVVSSKPLKRQPEVFELLRCSVSLRGCNAVSQHTRLFELDDRAVSVARLEQHGAKMTESRPEPARILRRGYLSSAKHLLREILCVLVRAPPVLEERVEQQISSVHRVHLIAADQSAD